MVSKFALLSNLLLASSVPGCSSLSVRGLPLDHCDENSQSFSGVASRAGDTLDKMSSYSLAGSVLGGESYDCITTTLTVLTVSGGDGADVLLVARPVPSCLVFRESISSNVVSWNAQPARQARTYQSLKPIRGRNLSDPEMFQAPCGRPVAPTAQRQRRPARHSAADSVLMTSNLRVRAVKASRSTPPTQQALSNGKTASRPSKGYALQIEELGYNNVERCTVK